MDWKCPECGLNNREDMAKCTCGYDANRPFRLSSQSNKMEVGKTTAVSRKVQCRKCNFSGFVEAHDTGPYPRKDIFKQLGKDANGYLHLKCPACGSDEAYSPYYFISPGFKFGCLAVVILLVWLVLKLAL